MEGSCSVYLDFERSDNDDGVTTLEAMASTGAAQHAAVMAEVAQVLQWCHTQFPQGPGPAEDGHDWDQDLQVTQEPGGWHTVTLTLTGSARFVQAWDEAFGAPE